LGIPTTPAAVNASGQIVGNFFDTTSGFRGFLYSNGTYTTIDPAGTTESEYTGINDTRPDSWNLQRRERPACLYRHTSD
jgi:probable HAF family extracellular repeat protein